MTLGQGKKESAISRVLSWAAIPLGGASPRRSSSLPGSGADHTSRVSPPAPLFGLAPGGVFRAADGYPPRGALLPHLFTLAGALRRLGGLFSVALSVGSRPPGVTWHPVLWSPDFPLRKAQRLPGRLRSHYKRRRRPGRFRGVCRSRGAPRRPNSPSSRPR